MLQATNLLNIYATSSSTVTISSVNLSCSTTAGPGSTTVYVNAATAPTGSNTIAVSLGTLGAGVAVTAPGSQSLASANTRLAYVITLAAGCNGVTSGGTPTVPFLDNGNAGATLTVNTSLTATTSGLTTPGLTSPATLNFTCVKSGSTYYPSSAQTLSVASTATGGTPFTVSSTGNAWLTVGTPSVGTAPATGSPATVSLTLVSSGSNECAGLSAGGNTSGTVNLVSTGFPSLNVAVTVNLTVSGPAVSSLVVTPSPVTVTCTTQTVSSVQSWTPSYPQTVLVSSAASGGTVFSVDNSSGNAPPTWLTVTAPSGTLTATGSPVSLSFQAAAGCNGLSGTQSVTGVVKLADAPNLDKSISVTLQMVAATVLKATPSSATFTYVKASGTAGYADVSIGDAGTSTAAYYFSVNTATLPSWLRVSATSGTTPQSLRFSSTSVADTLAPGTYSANVLVSVSGYGDMTLPISMLLTNAASQLTVQGPNPVNISWTIGQGLPTPTIMAISTDTPVAYSATTGGVLQPTIAAGQQSGLAYSFGTPIDVSFSPQAFASAQPGNVLTGTVTLTWGNPVSTIVVTFDVTVLSPQATLISLSPSSLPVAPALFPYTVSVVGTGFVLPTSSSPQTRVGIVTAAGSPMTFDPDIAVSVINQSNMTLTITNTGSATTIPFAGGSVTLGVCNPVGGTCTVATGSQVLTFGTNPIIQAVTSSSSLIQGSTVSVAPYDMISVFGQNFCPNCTTSGAGSVLTGVLDPITLTYQKALPFDSSHSLTVRFQLHSGATLIDTAPILFATNNQINLLVPSAVITDIGVPVDVVVSYGSGAFGSGTQKSSSAFPVSIVATDPGIFTIGADGQGSAAALDLNYNLISASNPAAVRTVGTVSGSPANVSDVISIYMTGLGAPDDTNLSDNAASTDAGGNAWNFAWSGDCVTTTSYITAFNNAQAGTPISTLDGTLVTPTVLNAGRLIPCLSSAGTDVPTVMIGGYAATVKYAGWVPYTVAGLYQVNVQLPENGTFVTQAGSGQSITVPTQFPITMTSNGLTTQTGVSLWVAPQLLMVGPSSGTGANTVAAQVGVAMLTTNNSVTASLGTGTITYAVTSGLLPSGLALNSATGLISGTPAANTAGSYTVTVTATDSANIPVTGKVTFVVTVGSGLFMTTTTPAVSTFGAANAGVATITASGGVFPYTYSMTISGFSLPTGLTINSSTGVVSTTALTPAGSYAVIVQAADSTGATLYGFSHFTVVVNLNVVATATGSFSAGSHTTGAYNTIATTGNHGSVAYSLDTATTALVAANSSWLSFSNGIFTIGSSSVAGTYSVNILATDGSAPSDASAVGTGSTVGFQIVIGN